MSLQTFTQAAPAAGAEMIWTVPTSAPSSFKIVSMRLQLVTSAVVANRRPRFLLLENSASPLEFWRQAVATDQAASGTVIYTLAPGQNQTIQSGSGGVAIPGDLWIGPGFSLKTSTALIDVGDQWGALTVVALVP